MVDIDGDGVDDAMPRWLITAVYALAYITLCIIVGGFLGIRYVQVLHGDYGAWPTDIAIMGISALLAYLGISRGRK